MLDERKTAILRAVVEEYITTALPVGSTHVADAPGVKVSSATVRNEMAVLWCRSKSWDGRAEALADELVDGIIATVWIEANLPLLFSDRDFLPYVDHLGLDRA